MNYLFYQKEYLGMTLVGVRAEVENYDHWNDQFRTHGELFQKQKVSIAHMGHTDENKVLVVFETSDFDTFMGVFTSQSTIDAMSNDGIVEGSVEVFILDDSYRP